jgi:galactarate dehydratase
VETGALAAGSSITSIRKGSAARDSNLRELHRVSVDPLYIRINENDNVGIVVNAEGIAPGAQFPGGLTAAEKIPQSHKIALRDLEPGEPVMRYGFVIGYANRAVRAGAWVREELLDMPAAPPLDELPLATATPPPQPLLHGFTFEGYRNADGTVGTRNILGITTTVQCVAPTVDHAAQRIREEILPRYPNVDGVVAVTHTYGCGVAIDAPGAAVPIRTIRNISANPNFGGAPLVVSLGCEKLQPVRLFPANGGALPILDSANVVRLQDERGFQESVAAIMRAAERRLAEINRRQREDCPASELIVGLQCGGSDAFSGVTCNPAVGYAADLLVRVGATVMFSEVTEVRDAVHLLTPRAATREVALDLIREMRWYDEYLAMGRADRSANTTPGNKRGGLANIVEKSLGSVAKAGTSALAAVAASGERVRTKGLVFAATPASDFICGTQQLAASMNLHVFTTGEGSPYGLALAPVIKLSSRTALAEKWPDLIDLDAGRIATGHATIAEVGWDLFRLMLDVASGRRQTWAEKWKLHNALAPFNPGPVT